MPSKAASVKTATLELVPGTARAWIIAAELLAEFFVTVDKICGLSSRLSRKGNPFDAYW